MSFPDLRHRGDARQRQESAELIGQVGQRAGDGVAAGQLLRLHLRAVGGEHELGFGTGGSRAFAPGVSALPVATDGDPHAEVFAEARARAAQWPVRVINLPSPGRVEGDGEFQPASHMTFLIGNRTVAVSTYGTGTDTAAVPVLAALVPSRDVVGVRADC